MLCLVLVLLKAIKERNGKERSAQKAPQSTLALPKQPDDELRSGGYMAKWVLFLCYSITLGNML